MGGATGAGDGLTSAQGVKDPRAARMIRNYSGPGDGRHKAMTQKACRSLDWMSTQTSPASHTEAPKPRRNE
ncbi:protein of unknown function [Streptomyces sp. KY75]|nr:protein of unknown function [Streptomyces sp. KY75]CAD5983111.1 protein of unknown function [Streptomyces sp. KY70]